MNYKRDIFYDDTHLSVQQKIELMRNAKEQSYEWWVDILDCSKSYSRQRIEMSFEDILKKFDNNSHFVIIHRRGYRNWDFHVEIGFRSMTGIDYFLWIHLKEDKLSYFIEKYNLTAMV